MNQKLILECLNATDNCQPSNSIKFHHNFVISMSAKPKKPDEIQYPPHTPEILPAEEPSPTVWPTKQPEILPDPEKMPAPNKAPVEIPPPPDSSHNVPDANVLPEN